MHQFSDPALLTEEGHFINAKWVRLNEIIQDHWPDISLRWIPPTNRSSIDHSRPYAVVHSPSDRASYVIMFAGEEDKPEDILYALYSGDTRRTDIMKNIEAYEDAKKMVALKQEMDERAEAKEMAAWFVGTHKSWVKMRRPDGSIEKIDRTLPNGGRS